MTDDKKPIALEAREDVEGRLFSPSAARNRDILRETFLAHMPVSGTVLEVGSGTGEHAIHIAAAAPALDWRPSDPDAASRASIAAWTHFAGLRNIAAPRDIDVTEADWAQRLTHDPETGALPAEPGVVGVLSINTIHIAPFNAARGLIAGAGEVLVPGGRLFLYGPFSRNGTHTAPSNADFDQSLRGRDPSWGVRDLEGDIIPLTDKAGLVLVDAIAMPANNFSVIFEKR